MGWQPLAWKPSLSSFLNKPYLQLVKLLSLDHLKVVPVSLCRWLASDYDEQITGPEVPVNTNNLTKLETGDS